MLQRKCACGGKCDDCKETSGWLQRSAINTRTGGDVPNIVHDVLQSPGEPLDSQTRADMEPRFGQDFSQVRVHADSKAAESARSINAKAYAFGQHVVFGRTNYSPRTSTGQQLLAHELAHTVQQRHAGPAPPASTQSMLERSTYAGSSRAQTGPGIARQASFDNASTLSDAALISEFHFVNGRLNRQESYPERSEDESYLERIMSEMQLREITSTTAEVGMDVQEEGQPPEEVGGVTLCDRDFAGAVGTVVPARHCFVWYQMTGQSQTPSEIEPSQTSTFDNNVSGVPDPEPQKSGTTCRSTFQVDPICVRNKYRELCSPGDFNLATNNCCSCAYHALSACGAQLNSADFPPANQGTGLPDSFGKGWKNRTLNTLNDVWQGIGDMRKSYVDAQQSCLDGCSRVEGWRKGICMRSCMPMPMMHY